MLHHPGHVWIASDGSRPSLICDACEMRTPITYHGLCGDCDRTRRRFNRVANWAVAFAILILLPVSLWAYETRPVPPAGNTPPPANASTDNRHSPSSDLDAVGRKIAP